MNEQSQGAISVAQAFASLSARAAQNANVNRLKAAKTNIAAGTAQITLQETDEKRKISQALARYLGTLRVNSAYRGTASTDSAASISATLLAGREAANVTANAAAQKAALVASNNPQLEDVKLAGIQGAIQGFGIGQQIAAGLQSIQTKTVTPIRGGGDPKFGGQPVIGGDTIFTTPGLDLSAFLKTGNFESLFTSPEPGKFKLLGTF